jgi:hypothetical protein
MPNEQTLPEQIIETSKAFAFTLDVENEAFQSQLTGAIEMTLSSFEGLIALCKNAIAIGKTDTAKGEQKLADTAQEALSKVQNAASPATTPPAVATVATTDTGLDIAVIQAVGKSYENAINAQQQMYMIQQAAATQIITIVLSVATATLGVAVKEAESGGK